MSYQVLARKWRPKTFREMVGQEHVLKALINALDHDRLHHAYLFTGTRGVGKTTIARILAKCLNCEVGVSSEPCGQCSACRSIGEGRFVDLIEVDAASRTKVEDTRELLENVQYAPTSGRYKVYLIDEVHMLSTHSFNALLKTLEEPPPHVKFLLATTDPQKLPATILSRCLQFNLKNMSPERIVGHLQYVLEQEMVSFEEPALWLLGRAADGSMRDAMSLADQAIAFGSGKLNEGDVRNMLGTIDQTAVYEIIEALAAADGSQVLAAVASLSEHAPDYISALEELLTLLHRIAIAQVVPEATDNSFGDQEKVTALAALLSGEDLQLFYQMGLNGRRDLPLTPDPRSGFEMVLLRMLAFKPAGVVDVPVRAVQNSARPAPSQPGGQAEAATSPASVVTQEAPQSVKKPEPVPAPVTTANTPELRDNKQPAARATAEPGPESPVTEKPASKASNANTAAARALFDDRPQSSPTVAATASSSPQPKTHSPQALQAAPKSSEPNLDGIAKAQAAETNDAQLPDEALVAPEVDVSQIQPLTVSSLSPDNWLTQFERLGFGGVVGNIASHCVLHSVQGDKLELILDARNATLFNDNHTARIQEHLSVTLNAPLKLTITVGAVTSETPAAHKQRLQQERRAQAVNSLQNDPNIQVLISEFDAELDLESVQPI